MRILYVNNNTKLPVLLQVTVKISVANSLQNFLAVEKKTRTLNKFNYSKSFGLKQNIYLCLCAFISIIVLGFT